MSYEMLVEYPTPILDANLVFTDHNLLNQLTLAKLDEVWSVKGADNFAACDQCQPRIC